MNDPQKNDVQLTQDPDKEPTAASQEAAELVEVDSADLQAVSGGGNGTAIGYDGNGTALGYD